MCNINNNVRNANYVTTKAGLGWNDLNHAPQTRQDRFLVGGKSKIRL